MMLNFLKIHLMHILIGSVSVTTGVFIGGQDCFYTENKCPNENITFWLYTIETEDSPVKLDVKNLNKDNFLPRKNLEIIIHGYTGSKDLPPNSEIRPVLLHDRNVFVISVDYNKLAKEPCYTYAVQNIKTVAQCLGQLINALIDQEIFTNDEIHVIGFSLGGQTAGQTANYVKRKLKHITGLDPAKPLFTFVGESDRLDKSDAEFVDVIHTDILTRGVFTPIGNVDFYPNAGLSQPECNLQNMTSASSCNHIRAPIYYAESIITDIGFYGYNCPNWLNYIFGLCSWSQSNHTELMGYDVSRESKGVYFLLTNLSPPYARGPRRR